MKQTKYDVFISYSTKDYIDEHKIVIPGNDVSIIKEALTKAGISYWFGNEIIYPGQEFIEKIATNIEQSKILIYLSTKNANESPWTSKEILCASENKKHIIPVLIDSSPYNKTVSFLISSKHHIDYYLNPLKGIEDLINSIRLYLDEIASEEKRQQIEQEQEQLISDIKLSCASLNKKETKLELERKNLESKAKEILDSAKRELLINKIISGGPIHKKYQINNKELSDQIEILKSSHIKALQDKDKEISQLKPELNYLRSIDKEQKDTNERLTDQIIILQKSRKRIHYLYWIIILSLITGAFFWLRNEYTGKKSAEMYNAEMYNAEMYNIFLTEALNEAEEATKTLEILSDYSPLIITDLTISNKGEDDDAIILSNKSTFLIPKIKYIGIEEGVDSISYKIFDKNNYLIRSQNGPHEYSYTDERQIIKGENYLSLTGIGDDEEGNWSAGNYRIEIWYEGKKLSEKAFSIY